ncbi:hypothetical protein B0J13DRAFT_122508 [Dactylonectria estremocensis]|uniref:Uncharacterized protein n=1 Tax=Dactylonectria estremocensis TaxID=1079267 RepID=A0A9P9FC26_9HYPO|nr:hypothetical protein B0J13DRAFT_122508 [Dactylonectria estremocensis]
MLLVHYVIAAGHPGWLAVAPTSHLCVIQGVRGVNNAAFPSQEQEARVVTLSWQCLGQASNALWSSLGLLQLNVGGMDGRLPLACEL